MAKVKNEDSNTKSTKTKSENKPAYGVDYLAKQLGKAGHLVRSQLRTRKIPKNGRTYGWDTKAEADDVVAQLKADSKAEGKAKTEGKGKGKGAKTPAKAKGKVKAEDNEDDDNGE